MPRLLTDLQARKLSHELAVTAATRITTLRADVLAEPGPYHDLREAIEHDLTECLERLMEPEGES